jgi:hypothetical protein
MISLLPSTHRLVVRFFEIYSGKVFDLFANRARVSLLEDASGNTVVVGLVEKSVPSFQEFKRLVEVSRSLILGWTG